MMISLGICLLAVGWLFLSPSRFPDNSIFYWVTAGAYLALIFGRQRATSIIPRGWSSLPAAVLLFVFYLIWDDPSGLGALILAAGIVLSSVLTTDRLVQRLTDGLVSLGAILVAQLAGSYLYYFVFGPRLHSAEPFASIVHSALNVMGIESGVTAAGLHLLSADVLYHIVPSLNNMGIYFFLQVFVGVLTLIALGRLRAGAAWRAALIILVYMVLRFAGVVAYDISQSNQGNYWWPTNTALTAVWLFLFLRGPGFSPRHAVATRTPGLSLKPKSWRRATLLVGGTVIGIVAWTLMQGYVDPGKKKAGRLMIDEYHSDWEKTEMVMDTLWYGQESTYNFYSGAEFWGKHYEMERGFTEFSPEYLAQFDVICIKTPTQSFSPMEIEYIRQWVANGGGLILIGDHTNVFGSATFLNQLGSQFGLTFYADIGYEIVTGDLNVHMMRRTLPSPIVQNMSFFFWGGQCTLRGDWGVRGEMVELNLKTLPADYSGRNFFPERVTHTDYRYGPFFSVASTTYGRGRIIAFTDSTLISNFFIFIPGRPELMLSMADFANREERFPGWRKLMFLVGGFALFVGLLAARAFGARGLVWMMGVGLVTFVASAALIEKANHRNYPLPQPIKKYKQLVFEGEYSRYFIPELRLANNQDKDFHTFFVWTQRVDVFPRKYHQFDKCLAEARKMGALLIIDPASVPTASQMEDLKNYVSNGGTLVVVDDPDNLPSPVNTLLQPFAISLDFDNPIPSIPGAGRQPGAPIWLSAAPVVGGETLYAAPNGTPVIAQTHYGRGRVIVYGNSRAFERKTLGYTAMIPNAQQEALSRLVYQLMAWIFEPDGAEPTVPPDENTQPTTAVAGEPSIS